MGTLVKIQLVWIKMAKSMCVCLGGGGGGGGRGTVAPPARPPPWPPYENILQLEVPVHQPLVMNVTKPIADLCGPVTNEPHGPNVGSRYILGTAQDKRAEGLVT